LVGIEAMNVFGEAAYLDFALLAGHHNLDAARFDNLLMQRKTVVLSYEDPAISGVSAAKPIIDSSSSAEKDRIELLITCTESEIDFDKLMSAPFHHQYYAAICCACADCRSRRYGVTKPI